MEKLIKAFSDFRSIWGGLLIIIGVVAWAGDQRYVKQEALVAAEIRDLERSIQMLRVDKAGAPASEKERLDNKIAILQGEIKKLEAGK